jgi:2-methylisocitrate lyase-like PEP mutase family enzyme
MPASDRDLLRGDPFTPGRHDMKKTTRYKKLIQDKEILVTPGVYDGFTARLAQAMGFKSATVSGAGVSESRMCVPDMGIMGLADGVDQFRNIARCTDIPLKADADTGYGNAVNVYCAVQAFEQAGASCIMIEDQLWPKRCGHIKGKQVISAKEMVRKVEAAVAAKKDPDLCIMARTDAAGAMGIDEAIRRANLYADAGADVLFADALLSREDIKRFAGETKKPVAVNMGFGIRKRPTTPLISAKELQGMGVATVNYSRIMSGAAISGMKKALAVLMESNRKDEICDRPDLCIDFEEISDLMGLPQIKALEDRFLTEEVLADKYGR